MFRRNLFLIVASVALVFSASAIAFAQSGELRGYVVMVNADGTKVPLAEAAIDVQRTDLPGKFQTKTNKKGEFVFAGLPYIGEYLIIVSHPTAQPTWQKGIRAGRGTNYEFTVSPGDGRRPTYDEVKAAMSRVGDTPSASSSGGESAEDRAKREEMMKKNAEIEAQNKKIENINAVIARTFKAGNDARIAKNWDEAIRQYDEGLAADPEQSALVTNKALALKGRGIDRYNAAITSKDDATRASSMSAAQADFKAAAETAKKALDLQKPGGGAILGANAPNAEDLARQKSNRIASLHAYADIMRLYVTKADQSQVDAGKAAYEEYIATETDPKRKAEAEQSLAQMLFDAGAFDKALAQYQKILEGNPDDLNALLRSGQALFNIGAMATDGSSKTKYQEAANYLAKYVEKAPDTDTTKAEAKAILDNLKDQENVKPERTAPTRRRGRP